MTAPGSVTATAAVAIVATEARVASLDAVVAVLVAGMVLVLVEGVVTCEGGFVGVASLMWAEEWWERCVSAVETAGGIVWVSACVCVCASGISSKSQVPRSTSAQNAEKSATSLSSPLTQVYIQEGFLDVTWPSKVS